MAALSIKPWTLPLVMMMMVIMMVMMRMVTISPAHIVVFIRPRGFLLVVSLLFCRSSSYNCRRGCLPWTRGGAVRPTWRPVWHIRASSFILLFPCLQDQIWIHTCCLLAWLTDLQQVFLSALSWYLKFHSRFFSLKKGFKTGSFVTNFLRGRKALWFIWCFAKEFKNKLQSSAIQWKYSGVQKRIARVAKLGSFSVT